MTDGHLAIWCLDSILNGFTSADGRMAMKPTVSPETVTAETISWQSRHAIHSSSIKSLEMMKLAENCAVFVGGGDDNALSVTVLRMVENSPSIRTISIPDAHASAITTIKTLRVQQGRSSIEILLATSGNDHQVKIWSIGVDAETDDVEAVRIVQRLDRYSPVADISSMDIVRRPDADTVPGMALLVSGVGMEMVDVDMTRLD